MATLIIKDSKGKTLVESNIYISKTKKGSSCIVSDMTTIVVNGKVFKLQYLIANEVIKREKEQNSDKTSF